MQDKPRSTMTLRVMADLGEQFHVLKPRTWKKASMATKIILVTMVLFFGNNIISYLGNFLVFKYMFEEEIAYSGKQQVSNLAGSITTAIKDEVELQRNLQKLLSQDDGNRILDANILSTEFVILAAKDPRRAKTRYTGPNQLQLNGLDHLKTFDGPKNSTLVASPVIWGKGDNTRILGYVVFEYSNSRIEKTKRYTAILASLIFVLTAVVILFFDRKLIKKLLVSLVDLSKACLALAKGDPDYKLEEPQGRDEVAMATGSFIAMREIQQVLFRFSNPALVRLILKGRAPDKAEDVKLTIGFGDGVKFTDWSAKNPAPVIAEMLTDYFTLAGKMVDHFEGIVEKFIGDAVMSYFGLEAKESLELYAQNAIKAKLCVQKSFSIAHWAFKRYQGRKPLEFRFGIATGPCVVGPIGAKGVKLDYTLIGSTVNLAARLEGIAAPGGLAVDKFTYLNAQEGGLVLLSDEPKKVEVKGFKEPVLVHSIIGLEDPAEDEKLREFLRKFFALPETLSIFRLTPDQILEFQAEVEKRLSEPIRLPVPKQLNGH